MKDFVKKLLAAFVAITSLAFAGGNISKVAPVVTPSPFYWGIGASYDAASYSTFDKNKVGVTGIVGASVAQNIDIEARVGYKPYTEAYEGAVYVKPGIALGATKVYGLGGYAIDDIGGDNAKGIAIGGGLAQTIGNIDVFGDTVYKTGTDTYATTVGITKRF